MTSRSASESRVSPSAVEPFRSEKTIVTVFRTSAAVEVGASVVPQKPHRRNRSGFCSPQFGQVITLRVYGPHVTSALRPDRRTPHGVVLSNSPDGRIGQLIDSARSSEGQGAQP